MPIITMQSKAYQDFRAAMKAIWRAQNRACDICSQRTIDWDGPPGAPNSFELHHTPVSGKRAIASGRSHLLIAPTNAQPAHSRCNRSLQAGAPLPSLGELDYDY